MQHRYSVNKSYQRRPGKKTPPVDKADWRGLELPVAPAKRALSGYGTGLRLSGFRHARHSPSYPPLYHRFPSPTAGPVAPYARALSVCRFEERAVVDAGRCPAQHGSDADCRRVGFLLSRINTRKRDFIDTARGLRKPPDSDRLDDPPNIKERGPYDGGFPKEAHEGTVSNMSTVLGIDAAWTDREPSGVAIVAKKNGAWTLVAVSPSYQIFHRLASGAWLGVRPKGSSPDASELLASAQALCGSPVDLVAIDMPLSNSPILGRRVSDNAVSKAFGARKCGTHSPSPKRPGRISDDLREGFSKAGYPLLTREISTPGLIEVYPHPALVILIGAPERLPYKISKIRRYWAGHAPAERRELLVNVWTRIVAELDEQISGVADALPLPAPDSLGFELKAFEDMLDAVVCAWVAICALEGRAEPIGDDESAIWIPSD